jgi:hypothetical protein
MARDVLYILGFGSPWGDRELRFSLRSLERHVKNVGRVFVVGENPGFLTSEAIFKQCSDPSENREFNIASKIFHACQRTDISEDFLFVNDDHIFVGEADAEAYPNYWFDQMVGAESKAISARYRDSIKSTREMLEKAGHPTRFYDIHTPIVYNRKKFTDMIGVWQKSASLRNGYVVKSAYANWNHVAPGPETHDLKFHKANGEQHVRDTIAGRHVFSFGDGALITGVSAFLYSEFPTRSKYESGKA